MTIKSHSRNVSRPGSQRLSKNSLAVATTTQLRSSSPLPTKTHHEQAIPIPLFMCKKGRKSKKHVRGLAVLRKHIQHSQSSIDCRPHPHRNNDNGSSRSRWNFIGNGREMPRSSSSDVDISHVSQWCNGIATSVTEKKPCFVSHHS